MDLADLDNCIPRGDSLAEIADFLCRTEAEVRVKARGRRQKVAERGR